MPSVTPGLQSIDMIIQVTDGWSECCVPCVYHIRQMDLSFVIHIVFVLWLMLLLIEVMAYSHDCACV